MPGLDSFLSEHPSAFCLCKMQGVVSLQAWVLLLWGGLVDGKWEDIETKIPLERCWK